MTELEKIVSGSRQLRPRTKELYLRCVRAFLDSAGTAQKNWTTPAVRKWRDQMRRRGTSRQSINVALTALRFASQRWANQRPKREDFADGVYTRATKAKPKKKKKTVRPLTYEQGKRLVAACKGRHPRNLRDLAIMVLGLRTGMLRFSMCQLQLGDLNGEHLTFVKKGGEPHVLPLDDMTSEALRGWTDWLNRQGITKGSLFRSLGRERPDKTINVGERLTPDGLYRTVQHRAKVAGLTRFNPNDFRHTFLAWAKEEGARPAQVAAVTGLRADGEVTDDDPGDPPASSLIPDFIG
jgi:integrase